MATKKTPAAKQTAADKAETLTVASIAKASLSADQAGEYLALAAAAAIKGKAAVEEGKAKGAAALAVMTAGFCSPEVMTRKWSFDIKAKDDVHTHVETVGWTDFGNDDLSWKRNGEGAVSREAQSAYKAGLQLAFFNLRLSTPAVWTMASKAIVIARAIVQEGMTATIEDGKLKLEGGKSDKAKAMREAKTLSAMEKAAKGAAGSNGTGGHGTGKSEGEGESRIATPEEITRAAVALVKIIAKGESTACNATLSNLREIARLVAANPAAFEGDM